ncbi:hypothetical protein B0O99DRAFT_611398 [Bisporella sp. PMI_857]|nr:hypothetical protein B0O99DRAFT_611398 [Bisporella sp. PMI_857]
MKLISLALIVTLAATIMGAAVEVNEHLIGTLETRACSGRGCCTCDQGYVVACCNGCMGCP